LPEEARRGSFEDESSGESSTTRVLVMLAVLVSLVAVLGMLQVEEKQREPVIWPASQFEAGVPVQRVLFHPADATATVTVDEASWFALDAAAQQAIGQRFAQVAAPAGAKQIRVTGSAGTPLATATPSGTRVLPPPAQP
jgi:Flp pilus assembly protein CpaB